MAASPSSYPPPSPSACTRDALAVASHTDRYFWSLFAWIGYSPLLPLPGTSGLLTLLPPAFCLLHLLRFYCRLLCQKGSTKQSKKIPLDFCHLCASPCGLPLSSSSTPLLAWCMRHKPTQSRRLPSLGAAPQTAQCLLAKVICLAIPQLDVGNWMHCWTVGAARTCGEDWE